MRAILKGAPALPPPFGAAERLGPLRRGWGAYLEESVERIAAGSPVNQRDGVGPFVACKALAGHLFDMTVAAPPRAAADIGAPTRPLSIVSLAETILKNGQNAQRVTEVAIKFNIPSTPSVRSFTIWGNIYNRPLREWVSTPGVRFNPIFNESLSLNTQWIDAWAAEGLKKTADILHELACVNLRLLREFPGSYALHYYRPTS